MKKFVLAGASLIALSIAPLAMNSTPAFAQSADALRVDPSRGVLTLAPLLERVTPAVVNISTLRTKASSENPMMNDPFFRRFFGDEDAPDRPRQNQRQSGSAGSGVIIDAGDGVIITNHHVIDGADEITVTLSDRRRFDAELVGSDPDSDLAVLRIDASNLKQIPILKRDNAKVGDYVIAIGNPFGLSQTVTTGIVSALGREAGGNATRYTDFIQTDAAINPGNSGGALINTKGELIGINSAILTRNGGSNGIGFAVPADMVLAVKDQLLRYGEVRRGRIGVIIQDVTPDLADAFDLTVTAGARIAEVQEDSPAEDAGLQSGDIIIEFNDMVIDSAASIRNAVGRTERGKRVNIGYIRDGRERDTTIRIEAAPDDEATGTTEASDITPSKASEIEELDFRGLTLREIPEDVETTGGSDGVYVQAVEPYSKAFRAGLQKGDIIRQIKKQSVSSLNDFESIAEDVNGVAALSVERGRRRMLMAVR